MGLHFVEEGGRTVKKRILHRIAIMLDSLSAFDGVMLSRNETQVLFLA